MRCALAFVFVVGSLGCTPGLSSTSGMGGQGGATSSATAPSSSTVTATTSVSVTATSDASTSGDASASSASSASSSSGSGGGTFPFCTAFAHDFNGYASEAQFIDDAVDNGPFTVVGDVDWDGGQISTTHVGGQNIGALVYDMSQPIAGPDCATTIRLVSMPDNGTAAFGFRYSSVGFGLTYQSGSDSLRFPPAPDVDAALPLYLALIRKSGGWFAAYRTPLMVDWTLLPPYPNPQPPPGPLPSQAPFGFGQVENAGSESTWDDLDIATVPLSAVP